MNKKGGIGLRITIIFVVLIAIMVLAFLSPVSNQMFIQASINANLSGIEQIIIENMNVLLILLLTIILFFAGFSGSD